MSVKDAIEHGTDKAIVLANIKFWLENSKKKDIKRSKHDGYYWVYNTAKELSEVLPYFTPSKVQRLLKQLESDGVILVGNYNKVKYDRTRWYSLPEYSIDDNSVVHSVDLDIGNNQSVEPIPNNKINNKPDNKTNTPDAVITDTFVKNDSNVLTVDTVETKTSTDTVNIPFDTFWTMYDYKKGKPSDVETKWLTLDDSERVAIIYALPSYISSTPDKTFRKFPMSYLNTEAWNDEIVIADTTVNTTVNSDSTNTTSNVSAVIGVSDVINQHRNKGNCNTANTGNQYNRNYNSSSNNYNSNNDCYSASFQYFSDEVITDSDTPHWWDIKNNSSNSNSNSNNSSTVSKDAPKRLSTDISKSVDDFLANFGSKGNTYSK